MKPPNFGGFFLVKCMLLIFNINSFFIEKNKYFSHKFLNDEIQIFIFYLNGNDS